MPFSCLHCRKIENDTCSTFFFQFWCILYSFLSKTTLNINIRKKWRKSHISLDQMRKLIYIYGNSVNLKSSNEAVHLSIYSLLYSSVNYLLFNTHYMWTYVEPFWTLDIRVCQFYGFFKKQFLSMIFFLFYGIYNNLWKF